MSIASPTAPRAFNRHTDDASTCLVRKPDGFTFTHEQLNQLFADFLPIHDIREVKAGFFIALDSPEVAVQAINKLHNRQLGPGWVMRVERAKVRDWPITPGAIPRGSGEATEPATFGGAQSSSNPNLSPIGSRQPTRDAFADVPRDAYATEPPDMPRHSSSTNLYIQGLPLSATWQSLKDWAQSGYPHSLVKPFVDVWRQEAHVEGRLGYRALVDATEAKRALEKWPYEGQILMITYHSQIPHFMQDQPSGSRNHGVHDEASYFPEQARKRARSPEPYTEKSEQDRQLLLDLEFARQRGHALSKEDLLRAQSKDEPTPPKKVKSDARLVSMTTAEEDKLAEALRILKEMEQSAKPTASYDWGTGKLVFGSASPEKSGKAPSSKTHTPALTFDDTDSSFASPDKQETRARSREARSSAWAYDEDAVTHHRRPSDAQPDVQDPFESRLPGQAQGRRDAGWGRKVSEPQVSPVEDRFSEKDREGRRHGYADQSEVFALQNPDAKQGFPEDAQRGFPDFSRRVPCRYFPNCRRGDSCAFRHDKEPEPALPFRDPAFMQHTNEERNGFDARREEKRSSWTEIAAANARKHDEADRPRRESGARRSSGDADASAVDKYGPTAADEASAAAWGELSPRTEKRPLPESRTEEEKRSDERREARRAERLQRQAGLLSNVEPGSQSDPEPASQPAAAVVAPASKTQVAPPDAQQEQVPLPKLKFKLKLKEPSQVEAAKATVRPLVETQQQLEATSTASAHDSNGTLAPEADKAQSNGGADGDELCHIEKIFMAKKVNKDVQIQEVKMAQPPVAAAAKDDSPWAY